MKDPLTRLEDAGVVVEAPPSPVLALLGPGGIEAAMKSMAFTEEELARIIIDHARNPDPKVSIHGTALLLRYAQLVARLHGAIAKASKSETRPDGTTISVSGERLAPSFPPLNAPSQLSHSHYQPARGDGPPLPAVDPESNPLPPEGSGP